MGMTSKTMTFVMFGDSYDKLSDVAKLYDRRAKAKRIKIVKRRTFSPSRPGTSNNKVVASGLSNPTNKFKPNKKNCMKKKIKCTPRECAEEDGDNFFLSNVMNRKKHAEETVEDINVIVTPNIHPSNDKVQNAVISLSDSHNSLEIEETLNPIENHGIFENEEVSIAPTLSQRDFRQIIREELANFAPLLIQQLGDIPRDQNHLHIPPMDNDEMVTIEEIRLHYTFLAEAQSSGTMRKRANAIMKGMWNKEERTQLVIKKNKRTPPEKREVTPREYEKIRKICLVLQSHREIDQGPGKDNLSNLRQWVGDLLKNKNYLKRKQDR
ncbi:hypothetical protein PV326_013119, partial [Microctonus aethiopoides]